MNIIFTDMSGATVLILPIVPVEVPLNSDGDNEELDSLDGRFLLVNNKKLRTVQWTSFFPQDKDYKFIKAASNSDGYAYIAFLELMKKFRLPIRVIFTTKGKIPIWNMLMSIDTFNWYIDKAHDIKYIIKLTECPERICEIITKEKAIFNAVGKHIGNIKKQVEQQYKLRTYKLLDPDYPKIA